MNVLDDEMDGHLVLATTRHNDVRMSHCWSYVVAIRGLHHIQVLLQHAL